MAIFWAKRVTSEASTKKVGPPFFSKPEFPRIWEYIDTVCDVCTNPHEISIVSGLNNVNVHLSPFFFVI